MTTLKPSDFIKSFLIDDLGTIVDKHPYMSFIVLGIGIEFLGKAIDSSLTDWNIRNRSSIDFGNAIKSIPSLKKYEQYLTTHKLYDSLRCGLAHAISPKEKITLSSKEEMGHLIENNGQINLKVEDFYKDFKLACEFVINQTYPTGDKMNKDFLQVPGKAFNSGTNIPTGLTSSYSPSTGTAPQSSGATGTPNHLEFGP